MYLTGIRFGGVPPFSTPVEIKFDERANVFVGANATGKSQRFRLHTGYGNSGTRRRHARL